VGKEKNMATVNGDSGFDFIEGGATADELNGGAGGDLLVGGGGGDTMSGDSGNDFLVGGDGGDWLDGGSGNDALHGGDGDDAIVGGKGNDEMSGGAGNDTFVFSGKSGKDTILDFDVDTDVLQIAKSKFIKNVKDVVKNAKQQGDDLVINLGHGNKIILKDVSKAEFKNDPSSHIDVV
jgi:Ca2+-binding RTX toxin-like protein